MLLARLVIGVDAHAILIVLLLIVQSSIACAILVVLFVPRLAHHDSGRCMVCEVMLFGVPDIDRWIVKFFTTHKSLPNLAIAECSDAFEAMQPKSRAQVR